MQWYAMFERFIPFQHFPTFQQQEIFHIFNTVSLYSIPHWALPSEGTWFHLWFEMILHRSFHFPLTLFKSKCVIELWFSAGFCCRLHENKAQQCLQCCLKQSIFNILSEIIRTQAPCFLFRTVEPFQITISSALSYLPISIPRGRHNFSLSPPPPWKVLCLWAWKLPELSL